MISLFQLHYAYIKSFLFGFVNTSLRKETKIIMRIKILIEAVGNLLKNILN
jgi:hypothetical protein